MNALSIVVLVAGVLNALLVAIGPAFIGYGIALLILGRPNVHAPECTSCRAVVSRETFIAGAACARCGAAPLVTTAARMSARRRGILFIVVPLAIWLAHVGIMVAVVAALAST